MEALDLAKKKVTTKKTYKIKSPNSRFKVAVVDFGVKKNILKLLINEGCDLTVFPSDVSSNEILNNDQMVFFLSNGPEIPQLLITLLKLFIKFFWVLFQFLVSAWVIKYWV